MYDNSQIRNDRIFSRCSRLSAWYLQGPAEYISLPEVICIVTRDIKSMNLDQLGLSGYSLINQNFSALYLFFSNCPSIHIQRKAGVMIYNSSPLIFCCQYIEKVYAQKIC